MILLDRNVDQSLAKAGRDYVTFIGSDFVDEGQRAGGVAGQGRSSGNAKIIQLEGTIGSSPANDRRKGFEDAIKDHPGMKIVACQSGDFARDKGRQVAETLLQAHPDATAIYAHNDEMAMGAIAAIEAAGKVPGKDVIDRLDRRHRATRCRRSSTARCGATVECNPKFGPKAFETIAALRQGRDDPSPG